MVHKPGGDSSMFFSGRIGGKEETEGVENWILSKLIEGSFQDCARLRVLFFEGMKHRHEGTTSVGPLL